MTEEWPTVNWLKLFNGSTITHTYFTNQSIVTIKNLDYLRNLLQLLKETPKRKTVEYWAPFVPSINLSKLELTYKKINDPSYIHQGHNCFNNIQTQLPDLVYAIYLRNNPMDQKIRSRVHQIALDLKNTLLDIFNKTEWLDTKTRDQLIKGINSFRIIVGYPDELMDDQKLIEYYRELIITQDNFIGNLLISIANFGVDKLWNDAIERRPKNLAAYSLDHHTLSPLVMEKIIFNPNRPHYVNYAIIGFLLSHEISHAIYNIHRMFTNNRTIENGWSFTSNQKFNTTKTCLIDQYGSFLIEGTNQTLNGTLLFLENSADNIGIPLAYLAYQNWKKNHAAEITFPTLPYNSNQLF
ncbi:Similar to Nep2: Neprilysin-2 (Drosophila melanogaster) [Cotesia congregata]|uniref:Similar to Nep2: Neprilysin-2 (Drosophila melanogaster) n=1 Tax=Cotesia congregata TaxID=51543 RepID=A0A8J2MGC9_COTCN|nr:Similar to Nep2: Neprilysin-2 (Drosophila melanogaster) [Cotesia congregata]